MSLIILLATQRSGTSMVRSLLGTHPRLCPIPEMFHDKVSRRSPIRQVAPYFVEFLHDAIADNPELALPAKRPGLVSDYLDMLERAMEQRGRLGILDVKYNSMHNAENMWRAPSGRPRMLAMFLDRGYTVIHLTRRDHLAVALSKLRAEQTRIYVVPSGSPVDPASLFVDPARLVHCLEKLREDQVLVERWLRETGLETLDLVYEELFTAEPGTAFAPEPLQRVAKFAGIDSQGFSIIPLTRKISPLDLREEITNLDEVRMALLGTAYEHMLAD